MGEKLCSSCRERKPLAAFGVDNTRRDGRCYRCRRCRAQDNATKTAITAKRRMALAEMPRGELSHG
jgi:transposase